MKIHTLLFSAVLVLTGLMVWTSGCKKDDTSSPDYLIQIDSIVYNDTIQTSDTLTVKFYGEVGPDGCYQFERFERLDLSGNDPLNSMKFKVWGRHEEADVCTQEIVYLNGQSLAINGFIPGNFNILVVQPDGNIMTGLVYVEE